MAKWVGLPLRPPNVNSRHFFNNSESTNSVNVYKNKKKKFPFKPNYITQFYFITEMNWFKKFTFTRTAVYGNCRISPNDSRVRGCDAKRDLQFYNCSHWTASYRRWKNFLGLECWAEQKLTQCHVTCYLTRNHTDPFGVVVVQEMASQQYRSVVPHWKNGKTWEKRENWVKVLTKIHVDLNSTTNHDHDERMKWTVSKMLWNWNDVEYTRFHKYMCTPPSGFTASNFPLLSFSFHIRVNVCT
jgi:hypothetical protein